MIIDTAYIVLLLLAVFKGYRKGFVVAVFSFFAIFIGLAAALKLSATVANWLGKSTGIGERLLPIVAFAIILIGIMMLVRFLAALFQKTLQIAMLGFINRLAGILLYMVLYTIIFSIVLFFANKISLLKSETIAESHLYNVIQPWGPKAINSLGDIIPLFKNLFQQLENFFGGIAEKTK